MPSARPKPPQQTKTQLMESVVAAAQAKWPNSPDTALLHILNYFTAIDLVGVLAELERKDR